jgi:hypothetical protein
MRTLIWRSIDDTKAVDTHFVYSNVTCFSNQPSHPLSSLWSALSQYQQHINSRGLIVISAHGSFFDSPLNDSRLDQSKARRRTTLPPWTTQRPLADKYDSEQTCKFPILDPFDASIMPFVRHPSPLKCRRVNEFVCATGNTSSTRNTSEIGCIHFSCTNGGYNRN